MDHVGSERFEVGVSRWQFAFATVLFAIFAAIVLWLDLFGEIKHGEGLLSVVAIILMLASATFAGMWLRRRPLYVIDDQGLTDYGYFSKGFGLIGWQNIESVTLRWMPRNGLYLFVKVNNFDELISRRNLLMQPCCLLCGRLNGFFGAQIALPVGLSDTDEDTLRRQISHFSKDKIQVPMALEPYQSILPSLAMGAVVLLLITGAIFLIAAPIYWLWQHKQ